MLVVALLLFMGKVQIRDVGLTNVLFKILSAQCTMEYNHYYQM
jgi:hypothetical protein